MSSCTPELSESFTMDPFQSFLCGCTDRMCNCGGGVEGLWIVPRLTIHVTGISRAYVGLFVDPNWSVWITRLLHATRAHPIYDTYTIPIKSSSKGNNSDYHFLETIFPISTFDPKGCPFFSECARIATTHTHSWMLIELRLCFWHRSDLGHI